MPLPKPNPNEKESDFINRCMSNDLMKSEYADIEQRSAVCYSQWRRKEKMNEPRMIIALSEVDLSEITFIYSGSFDHYRYGKFKITEKDIDNGINNFNNGIGARKDDKGNNVLVGNYDHPTGANTDPEQNKNSGILKKVFKKDGVVKAIVEWTDKAKEYIKKKEFLWISPEFKEDWKDENGKMRGFTFLGFALTNYPFLKKNQLALALTEDSRVIFQEQTFECECIKCGWKVTSKEHCNDIKCDKCGGQMRRVERPGPGQAKDFVKWTTAFINDLPDSSFAFIKSGGEKDEGGGTKPRTLRFLPYKDASEKVDLPHLRNALASLNQTKLTPEEKSKAKKVLITAARKAGIGDYSEMEVQIMDEKKLREILKLKEDDDIEKAVQTLSDEHSTVKKSKEESDTKLKEATEKIKSLETDNKKLKDGSDGTHTLTDEEFENMGKNEKRLLEIEKDRAKEKAEYLVDNLIKEGKILPAQRESTIGMVLRDRDGFEKWAKDAKPVIGFEEQGSGGTGGEGEDPSNIYNDAINEKATEKAISFDDAKALVDKENPELLKAYQESRMGEE